MTDVSQRARPCKQGKSLAFSEHNYRIHLSSAWADHGTLLSTGLTLQMRLSLSHTHTHTRTCTHMHMHARTCFSIMSRSLQIHPFVWQTLITWTSQHYSMSRPLKESSGEERIITAEGLALGGKECLLWKAQEAVCTGPSSPRLKDGEEPTMRGGSRWAALKVPSPSSLHFLQNVPFTFPFRQLWPVWLIAKKQLIRPINLSVSSATNCRRSCWINQDHFIPWNYLLANLKNKTLLPLLCFHDGPKLTMWI